MTQGAGFFVTGTDTDCGKTVVTQALMHVLARPDRRIGGFKPVAAGAERTPQGLRNADGMAIWRMCRPNLPYELINPICVEPAIAPHIAAAEAGTEIALADIVAAHDHLAAQCDVVIVEGAGGWRVPLGGDLDMAKLAATLGYPVVLVVGMRLGCLNHALLSYESIVGGGQRLAGWIANTAGSPMSRQREKLATLCAAIQAPLLGSIPNLDEVTAATAARYVRLTEVELALKPA